MSRRARKTRKARKMKKEGWKTKRGTRTMTVVVEYGRSRSRRSRMLRLTPPLAPDEGLAEKLHMGNHSHWSQGGYKNQDHVIPILEGSRIV